MKNNIYKRTRLIITTFVLAVVFLAVYTESYLLAAAGVLTGMVVLALVRSGAKIKTDERELGVQEKAARLTYTIYAPTLGISAFLLLFPSKSGLSVFRNGEWLFTETIGMVFAYLTLFLIAIYAIAYHFFNRKFGGGNDEK